MYGGAAPEVQVLSKGRSAGIFRDLGKSGRGCFRLATSYRGCIGNSEALVHGFTLCGDLVERSEEIGDWEGGDAVVSLAVTIPAG